MRPSSLPNPHEIAPALQPTQAAVITRPSPVDLTFDRDVPVNSLGGFREEATLVVDQHGHSPVPREATTQALRRSLTIR